MLVVIHDPNHQVLLLERADQPGFWQSVTGSKDSIQENTSDTAIRELFEETGIQAVGALNVAELGQAPSPLLTVINHQHHIQYEIFEHWRWRYAPGVTHNTEHWFSICVPSDTPVQLSPREHLQFAWLPAKQAGERCFSWSNAQAIERFIPSR